MMSVSEIQALRKRGYTIAEAIEILREGGSANAKATWATPYPELSKALDRAYALGLQIGGSTAKAAPETPAEEWRRLQGLVKAQMGIGQRVLPAAQTNTGRHSAPHP
jgi:hypothetical protein